MADFIEELFILMALLVGCSSSTSVWRRLLCDHASAVIPLALFSRQLKKKSLVGQRKMSQIYSLLHEAISGNKIIKAFTSRSSRSGNSSPPRPAISGST